MKFTSKTFIITLTVTILMVSVLVDVASARTCQEQNGRCQRRRCFPRIRVSGSGCPPEQSRCCRSVWSFISAIPPGGTDINIDIPLLRHPNGYLLNDVSSIPIRRYNVGDNSTMQLNNN
ncbi:unnamed protein product [Orchesella dallaii]|uniref:Uncharacterized protein n=1 Tax=Orchesella dallaii TaxID=48710 RepID=A0ABP1S014_9HEXA